MEFLSSIQALWTVVAFLLFIGILVWAWSSKRHQDFHEAAHLVFDKDDDIALHGNDQSKSGK